MMISTRSIQPAALVFLWKFKQALVFIFWVSLLLQANITPAEQITLTDGTGQSDQLVTIKLIVDEGNALPSAILSLESQIDYQAEIGVLSFIAARVGSAFQAGAVAPLLIAKESQTGTLDIVLASALSAQLVPGAELLELDFQILPQSPAGESIIKLIKADFDEGAYQYQRTEDPAPADGKITINSAQVLTLNLQTGFNLFNYPHQVDPQHTNCHNLLASINNTAPAQPRVISISSYDPLTQSFSKCTQGGPEDYSILANHSYFITMQSAISISLTGTAICLPLRLKEGLNLQGHPAPIENYRCYNLLNEINTIGASIQRFDRQSGRFKSCTAVSAQQNEGDNFPIKAGDGLMIHMPVEKIINLLACGDG